MASEQRRPEEADGTQYVARDFYRNGGQARHYATDRFAGKRSATHRRDWAALAGALPADARGALVLDCPSGTGRISRPLGGAGLGVIAADVSFEMLSQARERDSARHYVQADATALPFRDGAFDAVVSMRFIYHLPESAQRVKALSEMARVSRRWVAVSYFDAWTLQGARASVGKWISGAPHTRVLQSLEDFRWEAAQAGLKVVSVRPTLRGVSEHTVVLFEKATEAEVDAVLRRRDALSAARASLAGGRAVAKRLWNNGMVPVAALALAAFFIRTWEVESEALWWIGGALVAAGLLLRTWTVRRLISEAFGATPASGPLARFAPAQSLSWMVICSGVVAMGEIVWLLPLLWAAYLVARRPVVAAAAAELSGALARATLEFLPGDGAVSTRRVLRADMAMICVVALSVSLMVLKEMVSDGLIF